MTKHRIRKAATALTVALTSIVGIAFVAPGASAAVSTGAFNVVLCNPNNHTITHSMEVYRTAGETVYFRSIIVRGDGTGGSVGNWLLASSGSTARQTQTWTSTSGSYTVYMQYAVWNPRTRQYTYTTILLTGAAVTTQGRYIGNYTYSGVGTGYCNG